MVARRFYLKNKRQVVKEIDQINIFYYTERLHFINVIAFLFSLRGLVLSCGHIAVHYARRRNYHFVHTPFILEKLYSCLMVCVIYCLM